MEEGKKTFVSWKLLKSQGSDNVGKLATGQDNEDNLAAGRSSCIKIYWVEKMFQV